MATKSTPRRFLVFIEIDNDERIEQTRRYTSLERAKRYGPNTVAALASYDPQRIVRSTVTERR